MQGAGDEFTPLARSALLKIKDTESLDFLRSEIAKGSSFLSAQIEHATVESIKNRPQPQQKRTNLRLE
jgi:hypothetical protein